MFQFECYLCHKKVDTEDCAIVSNQPICWSCWAAYNEEPWQSPDFAMPTRFTPCDVQTMDGSVFSNVVWSASGQAWISPSGYHFPWTVEYWRVR